MIYSKNSIDGISFSSNINFVSKEDFDRKTAHINKKEDENRYIGVYERRTV